MRNCVSPLRFKGQVPSLSLFLCAEAFVKDVKLWRSGFTRALNDFVFELELIKRKGGS